MRFVCVCKIDKNNTLSATSSFAVKEKLFIPAGQYKKWAELKNRASCSLFEDW